MRLLSKLIKSSFSFFSLNFKKIFFAAFFVFFFSSFKPIILNYSLKFFSAFRIYSAEEKLNQIKAFRFSEINSIIAENLEFRKWFNLEKKYSKKFLLGKVISNIYASSFWVSLQNDSVVKPGSIVFFEDKLVGFVLRQKNSFLEVRPIHDFKSKFVVSTKEGKNLLSVGAGRFLRFSNEGSDSNLKNLEPVYFKKSLLVGNIVLDNKIIPAVDFGRINWLCIAF